MPQIEVGYQCILQNNFPKHHIKYKQNETRVATAVVNR